MSGDIYPWLFQHNHFQRALVLQIFSTQPFKYKASKTSPECYKIVHVTFRCKHNYAVLMILHIKVQSETRTANIV